MAPSATKVKQTTQVDLANLKLKASSKKEPLKSTGSLDKYASIDITPVIGTEYPEVNLVDLINASNADDLLRDLAIKGELQLRRHETLTLTTLSLSKGCRLLPGPRQPDQRHPKAAHPASWRACRQARRLRSPHPSRAQL
jgi:hypothetical protein